MTVPIRAPLQLAAPRQPLFAVILVVNFLLMSILTIYSLSETAAESTKNQGELLVGQLSQTLADTVSAKDTVGVSLLASGYANLPQINSLRVLSIDGQELTNVGSSPSAVGKEFKADVIKDDEVMGGIILNLKTSSIGDLIKNQWLFFIGAALLHILLFLIYRVVARQFVVREKVPERAYSGQVMSRAEYADSKRQVNYEADEDALATESATKVGKDDFTPKADTFNAKPVSIPDYDQMPVADTPAQSELASGINRMRLNIQFDDPKNFLPKVSFNISKPYYKLCDKLLDNAIEALENSSVMPKGVSFDKMDFSVAGVSVAALSEDIDKAAYGCFLLGQLYLLLHDVNYQKHRELKRFALPCKACVCNNKNVDNLVNILADDAMSNDILLLLATDESTLFKGQVQMNSYTDPQTILQRDIGVVEAVNHQLMQEMTRLRDTILSK